MVGATVLLSVDAGVPEKGVPDEGVPDEGVPDTVLLDVVDTVPVALDTVEEGVNLLVTEVAVIELAVIVELGFVVATVPLASTVLATVVELVCDGVKLGVSTGADLGVDASLMGGGVTNGCPGSTMGPWLSAGS